MVDNVSMENLDAQLIGHQLSVTFHFYVECQNNGPSLFFIYVSSLKHIKIEFFLKTVLLRVVFKHGRTAHHVFFVHRTNVDTGVL